MSIEFEPIHVRPMTEKPNCVFHYIFKDGVKSPYYYPYQFNKEFRGASGWCPATFTLKPPQPKEGEWWLVETLNGWQCVKYYHMPYFWKEYNPESNDKAGAMSLNECKPLYKMERPKNVFRTF